MMILRITPRLSPPPCRDCVRAPASGRLIALIEPRSNTMRMGEHREQLAPATEDADLVYWFQPPGMDWSLEQW